eukprot:scaffold5653_cov147-Cylindrotheca_fusiformis.AAC.3
MGKIAAKRSWGETTAWTASDHIIRKTKQQRKADEKQELRERRSALLTRDSKEKRDAGKLRLHIKLVQRQLEKLRQRLETWDDEAERQLERKRQEEEEKKRKEAENPTKTKKKGRKGPETWKLKGAARPAWEVYDFDIRYVDPYMKAHEEAKKKAQRSRNILLLCKGRFGEEAEGVPQPFCREFLSLLMQLGNLSMQANQLKTARKAFLECMELDSIEHPVSPARCQLMRMYMDSNRPDSARRLWERLPDSDSSVWIRYSAALVEFVSWKLLGEAGSTQETAEILLAKAIKANVFCAYYLAFFDMFQGVMDYVDEVEDAHGESALEEAIEYCNSEQIGAWQGTEGACEWLKALVLNAVHSGPVANGELSSSDLEWRQKLDRIKQAYATANENGDASPDERNQDGDEDSDKESDDDETVVDVGMFAGMFETAMDMIENDDCFYA